MLQRFIGGAEILNIVTKIAQSVGEDFGGVIVVNDDDLCHINAFLVR
jgi:hypothetical protein